ncbi:type III-B CRISPR-associated protein Cas10/Cmr2 [uncultured Lamprocystis sp.]|jgi:CRISPR-associated protein Cmr2|uniref:type III-B CRISPR-associated protein Cas10/Cmr2 n=1 Tax=uncultured Lamprocystis sp. TaxID=543132 RepID=UPI0025DBE4C3|nr:type III-B CRISPR-associated protein Cas10/Cmr2 [uncultured Lamprocystis sp.]
MTARTFHFTLGPVQGFVAQARRTRDFWAGSFLLSWLAGTAMRTVIAQGGTIAFPSPNDAYLDWLTTGQGPGLPPRQGCIPNRFKAFHATVGSDFEPHLVEQAVRDAWQALAETVWQQDLARYVRTDSSTRDIWDRQIDGFWEIAWVLGDDSALLDRRKNWRSQLPPVEFGVKCSVMAGWQELSGLPVFDRSALNAFWEPLRQMCRQDLAADETLCAIAFIKRRFVHGFAQVKAQMPGGWTLHGWKVDPQTPSTLDLAAANWLAHAVREESAEALTRLHAAAAAVFEPNDCGIRHLRCVKDAYQTRGGLSALNSSALFQHVLVSQQECPDRRAAGAMTLALKALKCKAPPSPFYAILLMDGDHLGQLLGEDAAPPKISKALETFTARVPTLIDTCNGFLIYAGGDDVLALLPLEDALRCALAVRQCYLDAFKGAFATADSRSTISAAVAFAHVKIPLTRMLRDTHRLLDEVAKDATGRDAIAVRVWKPGGLALQWAQPWECACSQESPNQLVIEQLAADFAEVNAKRGTQTEQTAFSSKFFYKIRERFALLNPPTAAPDQPAATPVFTDSDALALLAVDYLASGVNEGREKKLKLPDAERLIQPLLEQCHPVVRIPQPTAGEQPPTQDPAGRLQPDGTLLHKQARLEADGALLVRFLAQKGVE